MGLIRKTLSISTLGLVSWRSKKELLRTAEIELAETRADLDRTSKIESLLREKLDDAEQRATAAELRDLRDVRRASGRGARAERSRSPRRTRLTAAAQAAATPLLSQTRSAAERFLTDAEPVVDEAVSKARRSSQRARKKLEKRAKTTAKSSRRQAKQARKQVVDLRDRAEQAAAGAGERVADRVADLTSS